jgi:hypothetical protein
MELPECALVALQESQPSFVELVELRDVPAGWRGIWRVGHAISCRQYRLSRDHLL